jgi:hypothetical protein
LSSLFPQFNDLSADCLSDPEDVDRVGGESQLRADYSDMFQKDKDYFR